MSVLSAFNAQLVAFFEELCDVLSEEKDVKMALEAIRGAKKINPRLLVDLFYEHVYRDLHEAISRKDIQSVQAIARLKITSQFNEIMPALAIFDRHWAGFSGGTQDAIWKYLHVLCLLCGKARGG
jgi:hypothetical protein